MKRPQSITLAVCLMLVCVDASAAGKLVTEGSKPNGLVFAAFVIVAMLLVFAVHELGHLLTGLALGFRFELFVVFLLGVKRTEKGIKVYLNKNAGYMGGVAATSPRTADPANRRKFAWMLLAGPLASLLYAAICLLLLIYTRNIFWWFWLISGATSAAIFLATTLPSRSGIFFTDRARFQRLMSKGKEGKAEEALLSIMGQTNTDNSSRNISLADVEALKQSDEKFISFWGYYYAYQYYLDNKLEEAETSRTELIAVKDSIPAYLWKALKLEENS